MDTRTPSTYRCRWPWSGRRFVEVAGTIVAFVSVSTTWAVEPVMTALGAGSVIVTMAGDEGLDPAGDGGALPMLSGPPLESAFGGLPDVLLQALRIRAAIGRTSSRAPRWVGNVNLMSWVPRREMNPAMVQ
jgi:hypothetical protein